MSILRNESRNRYTVISQTITQDKNLSFKERGMLLTLLSLPDNWDFSVVGLCKILPDGQTAITNSLRQLERLGYLKRNKLKDARGRFYDVEWLVFETPQPVTDNGVSPRSDNTDVVDGDMENRKQSNTKASNPKVSNTNLYTENRKNKNEKNTKETKQGSFDTDEFYRAAIERGLKGKP